MKLGALILAGGEGARFKHRLKQDLLLGDKSLTDIVLAKALQYTKYVVVSHQEMIWTPKATRVKAYKDKGLSILTALEPLEKEGVDSVLLMEAVRPFVSRKHIEAIIHAIEEGSVAVISGFQARESTYMVNIETSDNGLRTIITDRANQYTGQTPEGWNIGVLQFAIKRAMNTYNASFSYGYLLQDSVYDVELIEGDSYNFKITYSEDYLYAQVLAVKHPEYIWGK